MKIPPRCMYKAQVFTTHILFTFLFPSLLIGILFIFFSFCPVGGNFSCRHSQSCSCMVDAGECWKHLWYYIFASWQPLDLPQVQSNLWCFCYLGIDWTRATVRTRRDVLELGMVIPHWSNLASSCLGIEQNLPGEEMDSLDKHPCYILWICWNATGNSHQHSKLACHRNDLQLFHVPIPQALVAEVQLCSVSCTGCRNSIYGCSVVLCFSKRGYKFEMVGHSCWSLSSGDMSNCSRNCC